VDVRDVAAAHYKAATLPEAGGNCYLACGAPYNNKMIVDIIKKNFPEYSAVLPDDNVEGGTFPVEGVFTVDASKAERELGIHFTKLETAIVNTVNSFKAAKKH
jgi:nucleoside-diphosphate-sugar epimerase